MEDTISMPEGTHRFQDGCSSIATSPSTQYLILEESESHDLYALKHAQLSRLARRHHLFTLQFEACSFCFKYKVLEQAYLSDCWQVVRESNPHKQIWSLLS